MNTCVIILNYRTPNLTIDCLNSLKNEVNLHNDNDKVIVVDNASGDASVSIIEEAIVRNQWSNWVKLFASPVNGGFSAGNNIGIKSISTDAYLLLNSDTIVRPGAVRSLKQAMQAYPKAGLISPRLEWPDGTPQISCFRYRSIVSEFIHSAATGPITKLLQAFDVPIPVSDTPIEPEWTSFACVMIRRKVIEQIGLMDEGYFMYFDDIDYCRRARNAGWKILHFPQARVVHLRGKSSSVKSDVSERKRPKSYLYASRSRYFAKFYGIPGLWLANLCWILGRNISLIRELVGNKKPHTCDHEARDIWINWKNPL